MFTFHLAADAPRDQLAQLLDGEADAAGPAARAYPPVLFLRALVTALLAGAGEIDMTLDQAAAYRTRDMLDHVVTGMPQGSTAAGAMGRLLSDFDRFAGWDHGHAERRDTHNGLPYRHRTAAAAHPVVAPGAATSSAPGVPEDGAPAAVGGGGPAQEG